jgi:outer membrane receptor protein involved in Fe transport
MRVVIAFAAAAAIGLLPSSARPAGLTGTFVEKGATAPLAAVEVVLRRAADSTVVAHTSTGADGRFHLDSLPFDRYLLRASLLGHVSYVRPVVLSESAPAVDLGTQALAVSPIAIKGVSTSTARATAIVAPDRNIYLAKDIPAAGAGTTLDLLRAVPELDVDINDNVSLRGSSSVTIQLNGRTSPLKGDALTNFLRQYPASRIERVEVIANPSAKFDPEGMAGIVNIVTKEALDLGLSGSVYLMLGQRMSGGGPRIAWQKGRLTLSGGVMGYWSRYDQRYDDVRQNFVTRPPSSYRMSSASNSRNGFGNGDGSFDFAFDRQSTLYGTLTGYASDYRSDGRTGYVLADSSELVTSRYDRQSDGTGSWGSGTATLGFRHVVHQDRDEWSLELRQSATPGDGTYHVLQHVLAPVDSTGQVSLLDQDSHSRERSLQVDGIRPLGAKGKLEAGYRGLERRAAARSALSLLSGGPGGGLSDYVHREVFHSGYLTAGSRVGRLSLQAGVRAEAANTEFDAVPRASRYDHDYRSVYPSANLAWDFGRGRTVRFTYSKRIERPSAGYLDPDVPALDALNRTVGNPYLSPKYTHSFGLDASWTGSRGLMRLSPFYRRTVDNWDQFKRVDSLGAATTTWLNASSIRFLGASLTASLRQTGRLGGTAGFSVFREEHDAGNLALDARRVAINWSANSNVTFKATKVLDLQSWVRYSPAQTLAQGRISATLWTNLGARLKLGEKAWASLWVNDPFDLWKYTFVTRDATHLQTSTNHYNNRRVLLSLGWSWGKPPEQKARKQADEQPPQQEQPVQVH